MIDTQTGGRSITVFLVLAGVVLASNPADPGRASLRSLAGELGLRLDASPSQAVLEGRSRRALFHADSRKLLVDGTLVWLNGGATPGPWTVTAHDAATVIRPLLERAAGSRTGSSRALVVLDPGHGGKSKGAVGPNGVPEKTLALDIAKRVHRKLGRAGTRSKLTRRGDHSLPLETRAARTARWRPAVFVSIHANYAGNKAAAGVETYVPASNGFPSTSGGTARRRAVDPVDHAENSRLAFSVHRAILDRTGAADRGIKRARFTVIQAAPCPALLVECGFLSNAKEGAKLLDETYRDRIAEGIVDGVTRYLAARASP